MAKVMVKVLGVIGARLNSSRLPGKQLLDLAGKPLMERLFQRLEQIPQLSQLVLATTADDYNQPLIHWAQRAGKQVFAFEGDVNDLLGRVDALVQSHNPEIVVYFCGDSPLIEPITVSNMIQALMDEPQADYVSLQSGIQGQNSIHVGFCAYPRRTWNQIVEQAITPEEHEHVGISVNRIIDKLRPVCIRDEPIFYQSHQRISVDTPSDYQFMREVYRRWYTHHDQNQIVSLHWVIKELKRDKLLASINAEVRQKGINHKTIKVLLVTQSSQTIGLGHLSRTLVVAKALQDVVSASVRLLIQGEPIQYEALELLPRQMIGADCNLVHAVKQNIAEHGADVVVFDLAFVEDSPAFTQLLKELHQKDILNIAIDGLMEFNDVDYIHIPSFYLNPKYLPLVEQRKLSYGWQNYLLNRVVGQKDWQPGNRVLVLTGGSDPANINRELPTILDNSLPINAEVHWIQGPYAEKPHLPQNLRLHWQCHHNPGNLPDLMQQAHYALTLYGVSLFELLGYAIPCVVWPLFETQKNELEILRKEGLAYVTSNVHLAVQALVDLMGNDELAAKFSGLASMLMGSQKGAHTLALHIAKMRSDANND